MDNNAQRQEKINKAYQLRLSGMTYREIGVRLDVSHVTARTWVTEHLADETLPLVDEVRKMEFDRLMRVIDRNEAMALEGDDKALDRMIKTSESLRKLLGVDVPVVSTVEHVEVTAMDLDIRRLIDAQNDSNALAKEIASRKGKDVADDA